METTLSITEYNRLFPKSTEIDNSNSIHGHVSGKRVLIFPFIENYILVFAAYIDEGPHVTLYYGTTSWESNYPDKNLIHQIGDLIENALA
jgi:hypothetical protein